jgi:hypothetical protein
LILLKIAAAISFYSANLLLFEGLVNNDKSWLFVLKFFRWQGGS